MVGSNESWLVAPKQTVVATEHPLFTELDDEFAILNAQTSKYYTLDGVGAFVWREIQTLTSLDDLCEKIVSAYKVAPEQCKTDTVSFLEHLSEAGLATFSAD